MSLLSQMGILRHMLGMASNVPMKQWGYRNYFNSADSGPDLEDLRALEAQGLVEQYRPNYWCATESAMALVALPLKAQKKLLAERNAPSDDDEQH
jgi:hypothetical protein